MVKSLKFIKNVAIYFFGNILTKIISFFLIPLYTNLIDPSEYGSYDLVVSILTMIVPIAFFQIWDGIFRFVYDYKNKEDKYGVVSNGLVITLIGIIFYMFVYLIFYMIYDIQYPIHAFIYGISIALHYIYGTVARTFEKNVLYMGSGIINSIINIVLNIVFIALLGMKTEALYASASIGMFVQVIIIEAKLRTLKNIDKKKISKDLIIKMMKFSMPIAITTISYWLLSGFTKVVVTNELGSAENGRFAIANKFSSALTIVVTVFQMSWHEMSFSLANDENRNKYYEKGINIFSVFIFCGLGVLMPITKVLFPYMVSEEYMSAIVIVPITYIYTTVNALAGFMSTQLLAEKNSKATFYSTLTAAICNVVLSIILTKKFGIMGANIALLIAFLINMIYVMLLLRKKYNINISKYVIVIATAISIISTIIFYNGNNIFNIIYGILMIIITFSIFYKLVGKNLKNAILQKIK